MKRNAFTLIELAIVLVIVSLIVGGISAGQSIILSTRIQSVLSEVQDYRTQVEIFEDKYASLPGDMFNAEDIWPDTDFSTDNGDGNGLIEMATTHASSVSEDLLAWEHLYLAGLVPNVLSGAGPNYEVGANIPAAAFDRAGYRIASEVDDVTIGAGGAGATALKIMIGVPNSAELDNAVYSPAIAEDIDVKADDSYPASGNIQAADANDNINGCLDGSPSPGLYQVNSDQPECVQAFFLELVN